MTSPVEVYSKYIFGLLKAWKWCEEPLAAIPAPRRSRLICMRVTGAGRKTEHAEEEVQLVAWIKHRRSGNPPLTTGKKQIRIKALELIKPKVPEFPEWDKWVQTDSGRFH
eukprot:Sspe_Gene.47806::Locus_24544_Transcript_3_3_Confidence_0.867_Length_420::g.47806::m.47806